MKLRVADEVLAVLAEAALENEHIHKAMAAMGTAQNLNEEHAVVAQGDGSKDWGKRHARGSLR